MRTLPGFLTIVFIIAFTFQALAQRPAEAPLRDIFFNQGEFILREDAKPVLREDAETLVTNPDIDVEIVGYCNSDEYTLNYNLGQKRAESTKSFLIDQGINPQRISTSTECESDNGGDDISPGLSEVELHLDSRAELKASPQFEPGLL
jgi:hypothetical protein